MLNIDKQSRQPIYEQIVEQYERLILSESIKPGELIPSVRTLSIELSINPNTIQKAYTDLERRGITYSVPGKGRYIADNAKEILGGNQKERMDTIVRISCELALSGIPLEEVLEKVKEAYQKGNEGEGEL